MEFIFFKPKWGLTTLTTQGCNFFRGYTTEKSWSNVADAEQGSGGMRGSLLSSFTDSF